MKNIKHIFLALIITLTFFGCQKATSQQSDDKNKSESSKEKIDLKYGSQYDGKRSDEAMNKWRENRFGQFIHWGLYAIAGGEWNGKIYPGAAEWIQEIAKVSTDDYMTELMPKFNPVNFNADEWAKKAKELGVKYMTITTKHHDGFCLWPSKTTKYNVANTPYKKDILRQLVDAYTKQGIDVYFYFSIMDWSHPNWKEEFKDKEEEKNFETFKTFTENQLKELVTNYPEVKGYWFDGTWDASVKYSGSWTYDLEMMLKKMNPGAIVNSRLRADEKGARHKDSNGDLMGDYESGYERKLPHPVRDLKITDWDWEAVMTVPLNQWGYHKDWSLSHIKTADEVLKMMIHTFSLGGNFMLNFGPKPDGTLRKEELKLVTEIGEWFNKNGKAIYDSDYAGLEKMDWGYYTKNSDSDDYYMHILNVPISRKVDVIFPKKVDKVTCTSMDGKTYGINLIDNEKSNRQVYQIILPKGFESGTVLPQLLKLDVKFKTPKEEKKKKEHI